MTDKVKAWRQRKDLDGTIAALREKIRRTQQLMRTLRKQMSYDESFKTVHIDAYVELNNQLKGLKIYEAELCYTRNKL